MNKSKYFFFQKRNTSLSKANPYFYGFDFISGLIRDSTGSYNLGFHVMGTMMIIGGLWLLTVPMVIKFEKKRQIKRDIDTNSEL